MFNLTNLDQISMQIILHMLLSVFYLRQLTLHWHTNLKWGYWHSYEQHNGVWNNGLKPWLSCLAGACDFKWIGVLLLGHKYQQHYKEAQYQRNFIPESILQSYLSYRFQKLTISGIKFSFLKAENFESCVRVLVFHVTLQQKKNL